jgi:hypothetical protein
MVFLVSRGEVTSDLVRLGHNSICWDPLSVYYRARELLPADGTFLYALHLLSLSSINPLIHFINILVFQQGELIQVVVEVTDVLLNERR